jgi:hypothetical protein
MFYVHMSDGTYTGYRSKSFNVAVKYCNDYGLPADVRKLDVSKGSFCPIVYSNIVHSPNIFLKRV